ncbi:unnamed protein product [Oncorhynchus mykiss]|uniref:Uncharacterized protein n=1 Tax=Oncorhynchus mykiss TaxID=8022 RepID=A0A060YRT8_ONCMY|nr:unnamed protein product [Oncorhynchus mykiss]
MENSDVEDLSKETLMRQFKIVQSHIMQFGNEVRDSEGGKST